jgi:hypothetical protein
MGWALRLPEPSEKREAPAIEKTSEKTSTWLALRNPIFRRPWLPMVVSGSCIGAHNTAAYFALHSPGVPFQNNFHFCIGPNDITQWVLNVQPVNSDHIQQGLESYYADHYADH